MGLRCSLIGHDWGESEIERDRDEQGSEVVLTVREYEVCARCDDRNLISENTEVTTLATDDEAAPAERAPEPTRDGTEAPEAGDGAAAEPTADAAGAADAAEAGDVDAEPGTDATGDGADTHGDAAAHEGAPAEAGAAEIIGGDAGSTDGDGTDATAADATAADETAADAADDEEPPVDDAVFIDDAEDDAGEGADVDAVEDAVADAEEPVADAAPDPHGDAAPGATGDAPDDDAPDAPAAADETAVADDDGVVLDDDDGDGGTVDDDREHGEWPDGPDDASASAPNADVSGAETGAGDATTGQLHESAAAADGDDGYDAEFIDDDTAREQTQPEPEQASDSPSGIKSAGETAPPGQRHSRTGELVCPNCQNAESADRTSLRAGDICPECRKGYLSNPGE
ncbi:DUF7093 family protein [Halorubellus litoreus]|uniref:Oxidoreductase n=1 Tax=Halorubellus litoreus TaxID=755308 RepID=A0ABD5VED0_9EURY